VVYLCVEPPLFAPEPALDPAANIAYNPSQRQPAVMIVGSMYRALNYKGHRELIAGWPQVLAACPDAQLWVVGGGDIVDEFKAQAAALPGGAGAQVLFLGRLSDSDLQTRYAQCRVFAMPSSGEGFGLVFAEAMRYGLPCIGGKYDSVREVVQDNITGLLVEQTPSAVAEACLRLLTDDDLAARFGAAGRQRYLNEFRFAQFRARLLAAMQL
jgi:phosphatidyl-myo-inositol dimannoside synthase